MDENGFGVPAGWYPDPLGLPQLRWWDNRAWTEHTSEARAPMVMQPGTTRVDVEDEELPSRREQREREKQRERDEGTHADDDHDVSAHPLLAMTLRELEPPAPDTVDEDTPRPISAAAHANAQTPRTVRATHQELPGQEVERTAPDEAKPRKRTYTAAVWAIAIMPLLQAGASVALILTGFGHNLPLLLVLWLAPYLIVLGLAAFDRLVLVTAGHPKPASAWWAILTTPVYLIARAVRTRKETGKGTAPITVWAASCLTVLAAIVAVPGVVISVVPALFVSEVEQTVRNTAVSLGADITLDCPDSPPLLVGEVFACRAEKPNGDTDSIAVSLQRANGWITWKVEDWGLWVLFE